MGGRFFRATRAFADIGSGGTVFVGFGELTTTSEVQPNKRALALLRQPGRYPLPIVIAMITPATARRTSTAALTIVARPPAKTAA